MKHRDEIDGLRAIAVLPVVLFHAGLQTFSGGFVGVDVFFVISGYLITTIIIDEKAAGTFTLARFYERRARRILPALFFVMFACLPLAWLWLLPEDMKQFAQSVATVPAFASNFLFFAKSGYFDTDAELRPLLHTWSLAVEEQYYLLFPLLVNLVWRLGRRALAGILLVVGVASLALAQRTAISHPAFAFYLLPARLWEILVGAGASLFLLARPQETGPSLARQVGAAAGLALIVYATFAFDSSTPFPSLYTLVPTLGTACIILFATADTAVGKLLSLRWLVGLGQISYSLYLWHHPLFAFARNAGALAPSKRVFLALALLAVVLAYWTWRLVEMPFRARGRISRRKVVSFAAACGLFFVGAGAVGHLGKGLPARFGASTLNILAAQQDERLSEQRFKRCEQLPDGAFELKKACDLGHGTFVGALLGDSHAGALASALDAALARRKLAFKDASSAGCTPMMALTPGDGDARACFEHNSNVVAELERANALRTLVISSRWTMWLDGNGENLDPTGPIGNGFDNEEGGVEVLSRPKDSTPAAERAAVVQQKRRFLRQRHLDVVLTYLKAHKTVVLVYPVPEMGWVVPTTLAKISRHGSHTLRAEDGSTSYALYKKRNQEAISILDGIGERENLIRVRPDELFCDTYVKDRCAAHLDGQPLYSDDDHLSQVGATILVDAIMKKLAPAAP